MRSLPSPNIDDRNILETLSGDAALSSHPDLEYRLDDILGQYDSYVAANGNPWSRGAPQSLHLPERLKRALRSHYESPPQGITFLNELRDQSPDVCPMCGSLKTGTLDHIYPKNNFPEFSIFSKNLVPACDCNTLRTRAFKGNANGQRLLHPYFDAALTERLVRATINAPNGNFSHPSIGLEICIRRRSRLYTAAVFHLENVILRTKAISYLETFWSKVLRFHEDYLTLPDGRLTLIDLNNAVEQQLGRLDRRRSTPNNWDSMLFAGLFVNRAAKMFLKRRVEDLRMGRIERADL